MQDLSIENWKQYERVDAVWKNGTAILIREELFKKYLSVLLCHIVFCSKLII
jgi:hypothetical protein